MDNMTLSKTKGAVWCRLMSVIALMIVIGAILFSGTAYAAEPEETAEPKMLSVDDVKLTNDNLSISVTNHNTGTSQMLNLNLSDYAQSSDEYVSVQATDSSGNVSNTVQFKNPYYTPASGDLSANNGAADEDKSAEPSESSLPQGNPFTPDGTGEVLDNATDDDGKEFFTVETVDGNVFYLIVDRERTSDNVYLLNAVTENDLSSLAKPGDGKPESALPTETPTAPIESPDATPVPTPAPEKDSGNAGTIVFIVIAVLVVGGVGYYVKIVRPKHNAPDDGDEYGYDDDFDDTENSDDENDVEDEIE